MTIITAVEGNALASAISVGRSFLDEAVGYQWGLYDMKAYKNLFPLAKVTGVRLNASSSVAQAPLEDGGFMAYNKVLSPQKWELTVVFMRDTLGTAGDQNKVLKRLEELRRGVERMVMRMPGYKSTWVTLEGYEFERTSQSGCDLLIVKIVLQEARTALKTKVVMKNGKTPAPEDKGTVVPVPRG